MMHNVVNLKCEYLINPVGIDINKPRLYWQNETKEYGFIQSAYQIIAYNQDSFDEIVWDSGKVESDISIHIEYEGSLKSRDRIYWKVRTWDIKGNISEFSDLAYFEMGLLQAEDWSAKWINPEKEINPNGYQPVSYLRKEFDIPGEILKARLYITACGMYEASINGIKVGNQVLTPGFTDYDYHIQYQTYDVTDMLNNGDNALGIMLADGWYRGNLGINQNRNVYGEQKLLLCQLEICTTDGRFAIYSDDTFLVSNDGPITKADFFHGEYYDARKNLSGYDTVGYDDKGWQKAEIIQYDYTKLCASNSVPIREKEQFKPELISTPDGSKVLDFKQNFTGYIGFALEGKANHEIQMYFGETLNQNGNFTQENVIPAGVNKENPIFQQMHYTFAENTKEYYKARFYVHGFRYVKVDNWLDSFDADDFTGYSVYSDMEKTGEFECSDERVNKLFSNILWSMRSNFVDIPTDCPTRERQGWNGDSQIFANTACKLYNTASFFNKWLKDYFAAQERDGRLNNITPRVQRRIFGLLNGCAGWGDAGVILPYRLWQAYGDDRILSDYYNGMKKWIEYVTKKAKKLNIFAHRHMNLLDKIKNSKYNKYIWNTGFQWGEWCEPDGDFDKKTVTQNIIRGYTGEVATAYYHYSCSLLSKIANTLGHKYDEVKYTNRARNTKKAYQTFYTKNGEVINKNRQASYVRPLFMELIPQQKQQVMADELDELIKKSDYKIGTGFLSTGFILKVLSKYNHVDTAYKMLLQRNCPGWLHCVDNGATTIWEKWDGINDKGEVKDSLNHYSLGEVADWFFSGICGISNPKQGYKTFEINPLVGSELEYARAEYKTLYGVIVSEWKKEKGKIVYTFSIPANTQAKITIDAENIELLQGEEAIMNNNSILVGSGKYIITTKL